VVEEKKRDYYNRLIVGRINGPVVGLSSNNFAPSSENAYYIIIIIIIIIIVKKNDVN
jgi:hypothetical protein